MLFAWLGRLLVMMDTLNDRIKLIRKRSGMTQKQFSDLVGVSRSFICEIELNKTKPSIETITGIARNFLDLDLYWFLTGK